MSITRLLDRQTVAEGTMAFRLEKPAGFIYKPGQSVDLKLANPPETDAEGNVRTFSLAGDPVEADLLIATRMRDSAFKRVLKNMPLGSPLELDGPHGDFVLPNRPKRTIVQLAGGIGITPFHGIALQAAREQLGHRIVLFYGNRRPEDAAFLRELLDLQAKNARFTCVPVMSDMEHSSLPWDGARGVITGPLLADHLRDASEPLYYMAGPPAMITALRTTLHQNGVEDDDIRVEEFAGY